MSRLLIENTSEREDNKMAEWIECTLGDLVTFQRGHDLPKSQMQEGQYPVVGSNGIIGFHNKYTTDEPSITIGRSGNVGKPFIYYGKTWSHNTTLYIKDYKGNDPVFVFYFLKTLDLANYAGGSAVPTLNRNHIHTLPICVPKSVEQQKKIGLFLKKFDEKIKTNGSINNNLEQQAQSIFDNMFPNISNGSCTIGDYITPKRGKSLLSKNAIFGDVPVIAGGLEPSTYHNVANTQSPVLAISASGANAGYVSLWNIPIWSSDSSYIDSSMTDDVYFWYVLLKKRQKEIFDAQTGSAQPHIYPQHIASMSVSNLDIEEVHSYTSIVTPIFEIIGHHKEENTRLASLRDTLLPKLMSGELDVSTIDL